MVHDLLAIQNSFMKLTIALNLNFVFYRNVSRQRQPQVASKCKQSFSSLYNNQMNSFHTLSWFIFGCSLSFWFQDIACPGGTVGTSWRSEPHHQELGFQMKGSIYNAYQI